MLALSVTASALGGEGPNGLFVGGGHLARVVRLLMAGGWVKRKLIPQILIPIRRGYDCATVVPQYRKAVS